MEKETFKKHISRSDVQGFLENRFMLLETLERDIMDVNHNFKRIMTEKHICLGLLKELVGLNRYSVPMKKDSSIYPCVHMDYTGEDESVVCLDIEEVESMSNVQINEAICILEEILLCIEKR